MEASASSGGLDVIRYRTDTQPIITDPALIFLSRKSRNINMSTLVADRCRKSSQKSRDVGVDRVRRRRIAVRIAVDVGEQCQQNGRLSFGVSAARAKYGCRKVCLDLLWGIQMFYDAQMQYIM